MLSWAEVICVLILEYKNINGITKIKKPITAVNIRLFYYSWHNVKTNWFYN